MKSFLWLNCFGKRKSSESLLKAKLNENLCEVVEQSGVFDDENLLLKIQGLELVGWELGDHEVPVGKHQNDFASSTWKINQSQ